MNTTRDAIIIRYIGYGLLFLGGVYLLYLIRGALPVFLLGGLLAYAFEPVLQKLEKRGYSRGGAVGFVFLAFLLVFVLLLSFLASAFQQAQSLVQNLQPYLDSVAHWQERAELAVQKSRLPVNVKTAAELALQQSGDKLVNYLRDYGPGLVKTIFNSLGTLLIYTVVLPIVTYWFMMEMHSIRGRALMLVPLAQRDDVAHLSGSINDLLGRYVRGQMVVCGLFGTLCTISFSILGLLYGMNYGLVLGLAAAVLYIVPYIGMTSLAGAAGLTAYLTSSDNHALCAALAVGSCMVFNLVIDYGIAPRVLGEGIGLHPLLVIFSLMAGASLGSPLYMIIAVPIAASLRVVLIYLFPNLSTPLPAAIDALASEPIPE